MIGTTSPQENQNGNPQPRPTAAERIANRRADMPEVYRSIYDRALEGNSRESALRAFCLECMGWQREEVRRCTTYDCPLHPYKPYTISEKAAQAADSATETTNATTEV